MARTASNSGPDWKAVFSYVRSGLLVVGIDEVGRGAWAGPVVAAAVVLPSGLQLPGLRDSKLLTPARRASLDKTIRRRAIAIGIGWVAASAVDNHGLSWAVRISGLSALAAAQLNLEMCHVALDGNYNYLEGLVPSAATPSADKFITPVAAASVIAKVARDNYMRALGHQLPQYHFARHSGYGTKLHMEALAEFGPTHEHRRSYAPIKRLL